MIFVNICNAQEMKSLSTVLFLAKIVLKINIKELEQKFLNFCQMNYQESLHFHYVG